MSSVFGGGTLPAKVTSTTIDPAVAGSTGVGTTTVGGGGELLQPASHVVSARTAGHTTPRRPRRLWHLRIPALRAAAVEGQCMASHSVAGAPERRAIRARSS